MFQSHIPPHILLYISHILLRLANISNSFPYCIESSKHLMKSCTHGILLYRIHMMFHLHCMLYSWLCCKCKVHIMFIRLLLLIDIQVDKLNILRGLFSNKMYNFQYHKLGNKLCVYCQIDIQVYIGSIFQTNGLRNLIR